MDSFSDLQKSTELIDKIRFQFLIAFLNEIFDRQNDIIIDEACETPKNQQLIKDHWKILEAYFKVPSRVKSTQKCVRQTLKNIVDFLNQQYQFKKPITFIPSKHNTWQNQTCITHSFTKLNF